ncbi:MAG TPA: hypothetical protein VIN08_06260, partial [Ohtaekwangia sp.]|uniref:hypothetical protein n=1 Tax=Ohtaekwangia sp. TaxID=2066019 RepID=UPI002F923C75
MTVRYQILFSIEVMNTYFSQSQWRDIVFIPLPETQQLLNTMGYQLRRVRNQLLVIAPVKSDETALKLPELYTRFSFALQPQSP